MKEREGGERMGEGVKEEVGARERARMDVGGGGSGERTKGGGGLDQSFITAVGSHS